MSEKGVEFRSRIVSNGYLFNENVIKEAKEKWNLASAQITLDGTSEKYKKIKNYNGNPQNPFEKVLNNIELLVKNGIFVLIRLNISNENKEDMENLIDIIENRLGKENNYTIHIEALIEYYDKKINEIEGLLKAIERLNRKLIESNHLKASGLLKLNWWMSCCYMNRGLGFVINSEGIVKGCQKQRPNFKIGDNIAEADISEENIKRLLNEKHKLSCSGCELLALCLKDHCTRKCGEGYKEILKIPYELAMEKVYHDWKAGTLDA